MKMRISYNNILNVHKTSVLLECGWSTMYSHFYEKHFFSQVTILILFMQRFIWWINCLLFPAGIRCLAFDYNMYGYHTGTLRVLKKSRNGTTMNLFTRSGQQSISSTDWKTAAVDLFHLTLDKVSSLTGEKVEGSTMHKYHFFVIIIIFFQICIFLSFPLFQHVTCVC